MKAVFYAMAAALPLTLMAYPNAGFEIGFGTEQPVYQEEIIYGPSYPPFVEDEAIWYGPGYYNGVYFRSNEDFNHWHRYYRGYPHHNYQ